MNDGTNDLSNVFKGLAESASLQGEAIYKIQLSWTGPEELKQASYALWSLPKGLRFLRVVHATESPKVMGLIGIHDPNALWCYAGYTYCPWCGKEGQNEGTMVNHLRMTHYRLGLVCNQCFGCPTVTLDSLCQHGHQNCQQYCVTFGSVCPIDLLARPGIFIREQRQCYTTEPPSPQKARFDKECTAHQPTKSIFCYHPTLLTNSYSYFSCDQDHLRKMLLITAKVVFIKVHQNNSSKTGR